MSLPNIKPPSEEKEASSATTREGQTARSLTPQEARQSEIAFDVSREQAPNNARLQAVIIAAVERAFVLDNSELELMELSGDSDEEFTKTKLGLRDGTIKLDTSWIE